MLDQLCVFSYVNFEGNVMKKNKFKPKQLFLISCLLGGTIFRYDSYAEGIATDGTLGGVVKSLMGNDITISQDLGKTVGKNLFHSFSQFNIKNDQTVTFTGDNALKNVISRVTGNSPSLIEGTLRSTIGTANFYFINPHGVTFGGNAQVDVPAAFYVSTADTLRFADGNQFAASNPNTSTLTVAEPASFGFLGHQAADINIENLQSTLNFNASKHVSFSAGNITINNAGLVNPAGSIRLDAVGNVPTEITPTQLSNEALSGNLLMSRDDLDIGLDVSGDGAGKIVIRAGKVDITNSFMYANNNGSTHANSDKGIDIVANNITVDHSYVTTEAYGEGNAATISLNAKNGTLDVNSGVIRSMAHDLGNAGNIIIDAKSVLVKGWDNLGYGEKNGITNNTDSMATGNAGTVTVTTDKLTLSEGGIIRSDTFGSGNANTVEINAKEIFLDGTGDINSDPNNPITTAISSDSYEGATGNAGTVKIRNNTLLDVNHDATIRTTTFGSGEGGEIDIQSNQIKLSDGGAIRSSTYLTGNAGSIKIRANTLAINGSGKDKVTGIETQVYSPEDPQQPATGSGGVIDIEMKEAINMVNNGSIESDTLSVGNAGTVKVSAPVITLDNSKISAKSKVNIDGNKGGDAGAITIKSSQLSLANGSEISSYTETEGKAGTLDVTATSSLKIVGDINLNPTKEHTFNTGIFSFASLNSKGNAGDVNVHAGKLEILNRGGIEASTFSNGNAGDVTITADSIKMDETDSEKFTGIFSQAETAHTQGKAGNITITTDSLEALRGASIQTNTYSDGIAGNIEITGKSLTIDSLGNPHETGIFSNAQSGSTGHAGSINVTVDNITIDGKNNTKSANISSDAERGSKDHAGLVSITAKNLSLLNKGQISSAAQGESGETGDIFITVSERLSLQNQGKISIQNDSIADNLPADRVGEIKIVAADIDLTDSTITAASTGKVDAGDITLNFSHALTMDPSFITTAANLGNGGDININSNGVIYLQNSGFLTSVADANGNGGNINVTARALIMDTGVIQANAKGGKGGDINLQLQSLIPSNDKLIKGGAQVVWQPFQPGFNVIQAASQNGVNGTINISSPQFSISGSTGDLDGAINLPILDSNPCLSSAAFTSSLARTGKGGVATNEAKTVFVPAIAGNSNSSLKAPLDVSKQKQLFSNSLTEKEKTSCMAI